MVSSAPLRARFSTALIAPHKRRSSFGKIRWHQHDTLGPRIGRKTGALIGDQRLFGIERAGVHQQAPNRFGPAELYDLMQQPWPDAPSGEFRSQSEIADLSDTRLAEIEFRHPTRNAAQIEHIEGDSIVCEERLQLLVAPK